MTLKRIEILHNALEAIAAPEGWWDTSGEHAKCLYCDRTSSDKFYKWMNMEHEDGCPVTLANTALMHTGLPITVPVSYLSTEEREDIECH